ncbi:exoenzymes regulatory protein AepA [Klebsiella pneumoniae]|uniref:Exoenzymes regulatory protein AepA n=1 Tax=Klebsiella pneumoniae TaxID=573 RepID=A0A4P0XWY6_KLEPN|nr:exoenzymes regulatory protein AepA [Klebsiella pneumoniae]
MSQTATLILTHGQIHTLDRANPLAEAVAIADGKIVATGSHDRIMSFAAEGTQIVDLKGHTVIPGLNDSHLHLIRGGLNYNLELRWEGVPSLADAPAECWKDQADRTPVPAVGAGGRRLGANFSSPSGGCDPGRAERGGA